MVTAADEPFSMQLERWLQSAEAGTIGALSEVFAEKSFATTILVLMFVPATPLPTGGITHVFEVIAVVVAGQMVLGRQTLWLPDRWRRRELGDLAMDRVIPWIVRWVRRFERFSRPRGAALFHRRLVLRLCGLVLMGLATAAALAPPFSGLDTLPAMGAVAIALSIILEDIALLAIGLVIGTGGTLLIVTVGVAIARIVSGLF